MHPYPHHYRASAAANATGLVSVSSPETPALTTAPPPEFDGPGGVWSPETLLVAAIADCFVLTFRAVARAGSLVWNQLECEVEGTLERAAGVTSFTKYVTRVVLRVPVGVDAAKATELLERAEKVCLVTNSLRGARSIACQVVTDAA